LGFLHHLENNFVVFRLLSAATVICLLVLGGLFKWRLTQIFAGAVAALTARRQKQAFQVWKALDITHSESEEMERLYAGQAEFQMSKHISLLLSV
jgi:hypothetical protein